MNAQEAAQVLGIPENATAEARRQAFKDQGDKLKLKVNEASTDGLRVKYREAIKRLEEAYEITELASDSREFPSLRPNSTSNDVTKTNLAVESERKRDSLNSIDVKKRLAIAAGVILAISVAAWIINGKSKSIQTQTGVSSSAASPSTAQPSSSSQVPSFDRNATQAAGLGTPQATAVDQSTEANEPTLSDTENWICKRINNIQYSYVDDSVVNSVSHEWDVTYSGTQISNDGILTFQTLRKVSIVDRPDVPGITDYATYGPIDLAYLNPDSLTITQEPLRSNVSRRNCIIYDVTVPLAGGRGAIAVTYSDHQGDYMAPGLLIQLNDQDAAIRLAKALTHDVKLRRAYAGKETF